MHGHKPAPADHPVLDAILRRWSPCAFDPDRPVGESELMPLLEAARWAASSANAQPWRFAWARSGEPAFGRLLGTLSPGNVGWAHRCGVLMLGCAVVTDGKGGTNMYAQHDLGAAIAQLAVQAAADGLAVHAMGGFDREKARRAMSVPAGIDPVTALAIGWPGDPAALGDARQTREQAARERLPLPQIALHGGWPTDEPA